MQIFVSRTGVRKEKAIHFMVSLKSVISNLLAERNTGKHPYFSRFVWKVRHKWLSFTMLLTLQGIEWIRVNFFCLWTCLILRQFYAVLYVQIPTFLVYLFPYVSWSLQVCQILRGKILELEVNWFPICMLSISDFFVQIYRF